MMQVYFHLENAHEREHELNQKLELARLRAERRERPAPKRQPRSGFPSPVRRAAQATRLFVVRAKCVLAGA
jgi:hypothetical protein